MKKYFLILLAVAVLLATGASSSGGLKCEDPAMNCDSQDPGSYDHIVIRGNATERGVSYGVQARNKILRSLQYYQNSKDFLSWSECVQFVKANYVPALEKYYPRGLEEMKGIAQGAGVPFEDILILNARYDLSRVKRARSIKNAGGNTEVVPTTTRTTTTLSAAEEENVTDTPDECTGAVALKSATLKGDVIIGQNWDINEFIMNNDTAVLLEVHPDPSENIKPFVMLTEAGQLGRSGMNSDGLGIVAMSLWSTGDVFTPDPVKYPNGWVPVTLLRRIFLEAPTFSMGLREILRKPRHVSVNMIIATAEDEALNIELTPEHYFVLNVPLEKEILSHSNHFKSPAFQCRDDIQEGSRGSSSLFRDRRVEKSLVGSWKYITEESFKTAFKDHVGDPNGVCQHSVPRELSWTSVFPREATVASIIFNLSQRKLQLCKGPPCKGTFRGYELKVPAVVQSNQITKN